LAVFSSHILFANVHVFCGIHVSNSFVIVASILHIILLYVAILLYFKNKRKLTRKNKELIEANIRLTESEAQLKRINSTKDRLFSIVAHDLKNPFNAMMGFSEILHNNYSELSEDKIKKYTKILNTTARNLYMQAENLLEWSRSQSNKIKFNPQKIDMHLITLNVFALYELTAFNKNIDLVSEIRSNTFVISDMNILTAILRNLTDNAIKYTNSGGRIELSAVRNGDFYEISVKDSGVGISDADQKKLFNMETFYSTKGTSHEQGTGLGLLLCKEFVQLSGGYIWVVSAPGKGSTFVFTLPAA